MVDFGIRQGHLSPVVRLPHRRQAGDRRRQPLAHAMISLEFLLRQAGSAEDIVWLAVNQVGFVVNEG